MSGWVKHYRKKWDRGYHKDWLLWIMMDYFIDFANHEDREIFVIGIGKVLIKRGQHVFAERRLASFLGATRQKIRSRLALMESMEFLTLETNRNFTLATVLNYDTYQSKATTDQPTDQPTPNPRPTQNKNDKNEKKKRIYSENSDEFRLSLLLFNLISERYDNFKKPNINTWSNHIRLMIERDGRSVDDIESVIKWSQMDDFWQNNILSTSKLRKQFDKLYLQMSKNQSSKAKSKYANIVEDQTEIGRMDRLKKELDEAVEDILDPEYQEFIRKEKESEVAEFQSDPEFENLSTEEKRERCKALKARLLSK